MLLLVPHVRSTPHRELQETQFPQGGTRWATLDIWNYSEL
jgi:hypothetical protein